MVVAAGGCGAPKPRAAGPPTTEASQPALPALTQDDVQRIVASVSGARSLMLERPVQVELLTPEAYRRELSQRIDEGGEEADGTFDEAFLVGFDFLPPPDKRQGLATARDLLLEQIVAFYDLKKDAVYVPHEQPAGEREALIQRAVLAHEVHHALQAQNFTIGDPSKLSQDAALARLALIEGDAMVAMGAYLGSELGAPVGRTLRRIREATADVPREAIARESEGAVADRAVDLARERLSFPYEAGMDFVADVYRAGGFPLVDQMYGRVPTTTEQILHPAKYLAGEAARPFRDLVPPSGMTLIGSDTMGELQTRILLERCKPRDVAEKSAAGWGGDRFFALGSTGGGLGIAWVSAWDSEADAIEIEAALSSATDCFADNELGGHRISKGFRVKRRGSVTAFVRGLGPEAQDDLLTRLLDLPGPAPVAVPLTHLTIPPSVELPEPEKGKLDKGIYRNGWLGIVGRIPRGMKARVDDETLDLFIERPGVFVNGALAVSTRVVSDELNDKTFQEVERGFRRAIRKHGFTLTALGGGTVKTSLGSGIDRTWQVKGTTAQLRTILIPICAGTGSIVFTQGYSDSFAKSVLDGWVDSFRLTQGRNMIACDYLDPK